MKKNTAMKTTEMPNQKDCIPKKDKMPNGE